MLNVGFIDIRSNESLYVANTSSNGNKVLYRVNLSSRVSEIVSGTGSFRDTIVRDGQTYRVQRFFSEDYAVIPDYPQFAWGLASRSTNFPWNRAGVPKADFEVFERVNIDTGEVTYIPVRRSELVTEAGGRFPGITGSGRGNVNTWGKAWAYGNGHLGFGEGGLQGSKAGVEFAVDDPAGDNPRVRLFAVYDNLPHSYNTGAASSAGNQDLVPSDLVASKTMLSQEELERRQDLPEGDRDYLPRLPREANPNMRLWQLTIKNEGPGNSSGFVWRDYLPREYENTGFAGFYERDGIAPTLVEFPEGFQDPVTKRYVFDATVADMPAGTSLTFYLWAYLKAGESCVPNTLRVFNKDDDANPGNDFSADGCMMEKQPVDMNDDGEITAEDIVDNESDSDTTYTAAYDITINSADLLNPYVYPEVVDTPQLPDAATITKIRVDYADQNVAKTGNSQQQFSRAPLCEVSRTPQRDDLSQPFYVTDCAAVDGNVRENHQPTQALRTIRPGQGSDFAHVYRVSVTYEMNWEAYREEFPIGEDVDPETCAAGDAVNSARMGTTDSTGCIPIVPPEDERVSLVLDKYGNIGTDGAQQAIPDEQLAGTTFALYDQAPGEGVEPIYQAEMTRENGNYSFRAENLEIGKDYWLVEVQSPQGYMLLPKQVQFQIVKSDSLESGPGEADFTSGDYVVVVQDGFGFVEPGEDASRPEGEDTIFLAVANYRQGELPNTGGSGVTWVLLLGMVLVGAGAGVARRRVA